MPEKINVRRVARRSVCLEWNEKGKSDIKLYLWIRVSSVVAWDSKASAYTVEGPCSIPGSGRSPREGDGNPLQYSCLEIPWTKEPGGLQSMGLQRVRHDWATFLLHFMNKSGAQWLEAAYAKLYRRWLFLGIFILRDSKWVQDLIWLDFVKYRWPWTRSVWIAWVHLYVDFFQ